MKSAKVFQNGQSQAIRLPKEFRFPPGQKEVLVKKVGNALLIISQDKMWEDWLACFDHFPEDFLSEGRQQPFETERDWS